MNQDFQSIVRRFQDREEAGQLLADKLWPYKNDPNGVVYALPRGGVVVGFEIAKALGLPLELAIARKIGHPYVPEYAICAVTEEGEPLCEELERASIDPGWLEVEIEQARREAARRREIYLKGRERISAEGKTAIVVDDGVATGLTLRAVLRSLQAHNPKQIIVAVPVAPFEAAEILRQEADQLILLDDERNFLGAVGAHYNRFEQVSDQEVVQMITQAANLLKRH